MTQAWHFPADLEDVGAISPRAARLLFDACRRAEYDLMRFRPDGNGTLRQLRTAIDAVLEDDGWLERHFPDPPKRRRRAARRDSHSLSEKQ